MGRLTLLALTACLAYPPADPGGAKVVLTTPFIEESTAICDAEAGRWKLTLHASSWTGGATSAWTVDGSYVELHRFDQKSWAGDGSHERLELTLPIVDDWREVTDNSTVFTCAQAPSGVLHLADLDGVVVDCRSWGPNPEIFATVEGVEPCDQAVDTEL